MYKYIYISLSHFSFFFVPLFSSECVLYSEHIFPCLSYIRVQSLLGSATETGVLGPLMGNPHCRMSNLRNNNGGCRCRLFFRNVTCRI